MARNNQFQQARKYITEFVLSLEYVEGNSIP